VRKSLESLSVVVVLVAAITVSGFIFFNSGQVPETPSWSTPVVILSEDLDYSPIGLVYQSVFFDITIGSLMSQVQLSIAVDTGHGICSIANSTDTVVYSGDVSIVDNYTSLWTDIHPGDYTVIVGFGFLTAHLTVLARGLIYPPPT
jgi:hypothetical protein